MIYTPLTATTLQIQTIEISPKKRLPQIQDQCEKQRITEQYNNASLCFVELCGTESSPLSPHNAGVGGSNPPVATKYQGLRRVRLSLFLWFIAH